jgi:hypothetical protein
MRVVSRISVGLLCLYASILNLTFRQLALKQLRACNNHNDISLSVQEDLRILSDLGRGACCVVRKVFDTYTHFHMLSNKRQHFV